MFARYALGFMSAVLIGAAVFSLQPQEEQLKLLGSIGLSYGSSASSLPSCSSQGGFCDYLQPCCNDPLNPVLACNNNVCVPMVFQASGNSTSSASAPAVQSSSATTSTAVTVSTSSSSASSCPHFQKLGSWDWYVSFGFLGTPPIDVENCPDNPVGTCCRNPANPATACGVAETKSQCIGNGTTIMDPFYTPTWSTPPDACGSCPGVEPPPPPTPTGTTACCLYDFDSANDSTWEVIGCQMRPTSTKTSCTTPGETIAGVPVYGQPRPDLTSAQCPANAVTVCAKGPIDLSVQNTPPAAQIWNVGDQVSFTVTVTNKDTTMAAFNTRISYIYEKSAAEKNLTYVSVTTQNAPSPTEAVTCSINSGKLLCSLGIIKPTKSKTFTLVFTLNERTSDCDLFTKALVFADNNVQEGTGGDNYAIAGLHAYCGATTSLSSASASASAPPPPVSAACCLTAGPLNLPICWPSAGTETKCSALVGGNIQYLGGGLKVNTAVWKQSMQCPATGLGPCQPASPPTTSAPASATTTSTSTSVTTSSVSSAPADLILEYTQLPPLPGEIVTLNGVAMHLAGSKLRYRAFIKNTGGAATARLVIQPPMNGAKLETSHPSCVQSSSQIQCTNLTVPPEGLALDFVYVLEPSDTSLCSQTYTTGRSVAWLYADLRFNSNNGSQVGVASNDVAEAAGATAQCPAWEITQAVSPAGPHKKGQTIQIAVTYKRIGGAYVPKQSPLTEINLDKAVQPLEFIKPSSVPVGCTSYPLQAGSYAVQCPLPATGKDESFTITIPGVVMDAACAGEKKWRSAVSISHRTPSLYAPLPGGSSLEGTVDCSSEPVTYCCSASGNACVAKTSSAVCAPTSKTYSAEEANCGNACSGAKVFCCSKDNFCAQKGTPGVVCKTTNEYAEGCAGVCPQPAPVEYCCSSNECKPATPGMTCDNNLVPSSDSTCGGPDTCRPSEPEGACCRAGAANAVCSNTKKEACTDGTWIGQGTQCSTAACPQPRPCCLPAGQCSFLVPAQCAKEGGTTKMDAPACTLALCEPAPQFGRCCAPSGCVPNTTQSACLGLKGVWNSGKTCAQTPQCPTIAASSASSLAGTTGGNSSSATTPPTEPTQLCGVCPPEKWHESTFGPLLRLFNINSGTCDVPIVACPTDGGEKSSSSSSSSVTSENSLSSAAASSAQSSGKPSIFDMLKIVIFGIQAPTPIINTVEECAPGKFADALRGCSDIPNCPNLSTESSPSTLNFYCSLQCQSAVDKGACTAACVCKCRPGGGANKATTAASCAAACTRGSEERCRGKTGDALTDCCVGECTGKEGMGCPL